MKKKKKSKELSFDMIPSWLMWVLAKGWRTFVAVTIVITMVFGLIPVFKWLEKCDPTIRTMEMEQLLFVSFLGYAFLFAWILVIIFGLIGNKLENRKKNERRRVSR